MFGFNLFGDALRDWFDPKMKTTYQNKRVIYDLLFKASAETMLTIAADPKHLGAKIAITSVMHTWGSAMTHHPHVHVIVPGGGLSSAGSRPGATSSCRCWCFPSCSAA